MSDSRIPVLLNNPPLSSTSSNLLLLEVSKDLYLNAFSCWEIRILRVHESRMEECNIVVRVAVHLLEQQRFIGSLSTQIVPLMFLTESGKSNLHDSFRSNSTVIVDIVVGVDRFPVTDPKRISENLLDRSPHIHYHEPASEKTLNFFIVWKHVLQEVSAGCSGHVCVDSV